MHRTSKKNIDRSQTCLWHKIGKERERTHFTSLCLDACYKILQNKIHCHQGVDQQHLSSKYSGDMRGGPTPLANMIWQHSISNEHSWSSWKSSKASHTMANMSSCYISFDGHQGRPHNGQYARFIILKHFPQCHHNHPRQATQWPTCMDHHSQKYYKLLVVITITLIFER